jgi:hypothetical protein
MMDRYEPLSEKQGDSVSYKSVEAAIKGLANEWWQLDVEHANDIDNFTENANQIYDKLYPLLRKWFPTIEWGDNSFNDKN